MLGTCNYTVLLSDLSIAIIPIYIYIYMLAITPLGYFVCFAFALIPYATLYASIHTPWCSNLTYSVREITIW